MSKSTRKSEHATEAADERRPKKAKTSSARVPPAAVLRAEAARTAALLEQAKAEAKAASKLLYAAETEKSQLFKASSEISKWGNERQQAKAWDTYYAQLDVVAGLREAYDAAVRKLVAAEAAAATAAAKAKVDVTWALYIKQCDAVVAALNVRGYLRESGTTKEREDARSEYTRLDGEKAVARAAWTAAEAELKALKEEQAAVRASGKAAATVKPSRVVPGQ
tara:strand:- start:579 stop:1244 length:666 start_codon:yes stop_codon:yes gene_type:complete